MAVNAASQVLLLPLALDEGEQVGIELILVRDEQAVGGALVLLVHAVWDQYGGGRAGQGGDRVLVGGAVNDERENREASQVRAEVGVEDGMPGPLRHHHRGFHRRSVTRRRCRAGWEAMSGDQAELPGPGDGLGPVGRAELTQDMAYMLLDGVEGCLLYTSPSPRDS